MINVQVFFEGKDLPKYQTPQSAGCEVCAFLDTGLYSVTIDPGEIKLINTGLSVAIPEGYEIQVRPRSGLAAKHGITVLNTPGTIDADYRGLIKVILINHGDKPFEIKNGERIAQLVLNKVEQINWVPVVSTDELEQSERGEGGFGSTGR
jgi:dUTP pyrophosphatase